MAGIELATSIPHNFRSETSSAPEKPTEKCGIVGIRTFEPTEHFATLIKAAYGVQHRGQLGAGVRIVQEEGTRFLRIGDELIAQVFPSKVILEERLFNRRGKLSGFHGRYGTDGDWGEGNNQPIEKKHHGTGTEIAVFHNGQFTDIEGMRRTVGVERNGASDTHLFAEMLARSEGENWDERILSTLDKVNGAYNLIIHVGDVMYVARDQFGLHPFVMGKVSFRDTEGIIVASETSALSDAATDNEDAEVEFLRQVRRGEVFRVDDSGLTTLREGEEGESATCSFEIAYFARADSLDSTGRAIALTRTRLGEILAERIKIPNASFVVGLPDSGIDMAEGYANASGIPYKHYIRRNHYSPHGSQRAFQNDYDIPGIRAIVAKKLIYVAGPHWRDAVVVLADDSIVRGSGSSEVVEKLLGFGAREIHFLVSLPPIRHPCHLAISMRTAEELVANQGDVAKLIGATSVNYTTPEEFIRAYREIDIRIPEDQAEIFLENDMCGGCITGVHPIDRGGVVWQKRGEPIPVEFVYSR